jgi:hypothetical protein
LRRLPVDFVESICGSLSSVRNEVSKDRPLRQSLEPGSKPSLENLTKQERGKVDGDRASCLALALTACDENAGGTRQDQADGERIEEVLDLFIPTVELVDLIEEQHHALPRSTRELLSVPPDERQKSGLAQLLKVESNEKERVWADPCRDEICDDLLERRRLSDLSGAAQDVDEGLRSTERSDDGRHSAAAELRWYWANSMRRFPPGIQVP